MAVPIHVRGRQRKIGLGPVGTLGHADARGEAQTPHAKMRDGVDRLTQRLLEEPEARQPVVTIALGSR